MPNTVLDRARDLLGHRLAEAVRIDHWPEQIGPWLEQAREVLAFAVRRAREVRLAQVAGSLTFTTVLSIVPMAAVALAVFSAFPLFDEYRGVLERMLLRELLPPQISSTILRYLTEFTTKAGALTAYGLAFLTVTALLMIHTVDRVLNDIWKVQTARPLLARVLVYWALLTLAPLVAGASVSATSYVLAASGRLRTEATGLLGAALDVAPFLLGGLALAALYVVVPNRRVLWRDALVGGYVASALGVALSSGFGLYIRTGTLTGIYGAFSAVPLFLLWVYLSWYALLFGAAIAATLPMLRTTRFADERRAGNSFLTAVALLRLLLQARTSGVDDGRMSTDALARAVRSPVEDVERLLAELERLGYVSTLDGAHVGKWLLTRDPATTTLQPVFARLAVDPGNSLLARHAALRDWVDAAMAAPWLQQPLTEALAEARSAATDRAAAS